MIEKEKKCADASENAHESNITYAGIATPKLEKELLDKNMSVLIRELDAKKHEDEVTTEKAKDK